MNKKAEVVEWACVHMPGAFNTPETLTFWPLGQCMPSDCYRVHVYQVWCW